MEFNSTAATALVQALHYHNSLTAEDKLPTDDEVIATAKKFNAFLVGSDSTAAVAAAPKPVVPAAPKSSTPSATTTTITTPAYDAVAKVVTDFLKANGRAAAVILLEPFKVTSITGFKEKPAELAQILAIFTDPVKIEAAKARAKSEAAAAAKPA